jgi:nicotinamide-nucleotide amidase
MTIVREIGDILRTRGWWLCAAESMTIGRIQVIIGGTPGASEFFVGGITAYTLEQKVRQLGVDHDEAAATDCVSPLVCQQMARGACRLFQTDLAIATTGYAEATSELGISRPFAFVSIYQARAADQEVFATRVECDEADPWLDRSVLRQRCQQFVAETAVESLYEFLRRD